MALLVCKLRFFSIVISGHSFGKATGGRNAICQGILLNSYPPGTPMTPFTQKSYRLLIRLAVPFGLKIFTPETFCLYLLKDRSVQDFAVFFLIQNGWRNEKLSMASVFPYSLLPVRPGCHGNY